MTALDLLFPTLLTDRAVTNCGRALLLGAAIAALTPSTRAQEWVGLAENSTIGYTDRGTLGTAAGEVMVRLDASEHGGWGTDFGKNKRAVTGVRVALIDRNPFTAESFSITLHNEIAAGVPNPVGVAFGLPSPAVPGVLTVFDITLLPCAAVVLPLTFTGHVYVSIHLPGNLGWPLDGLEVGVVSGAPPGSLTWDVAGIGYAPSHNLDRIGLGAILPQATIGHYFVDVRHGSPCSPLAGGVGGTITNQLSFPISGAVPGTADFLSGSFPDATRADSLCMTSRAAFAPSNPVAFVLSFGAMVPFASEFLLGSTWVGYTGALCLPSLDIMSFAFSNAAGYADICYGPLWPALLGLSVTHQAFVLDTFTGFIHAGPCDHQQM